MWQRQRERRFRHSPIGHNTIRLLELLPARTASDWIQCNLSSHSLDDAAEIPAYGAISHISARTDSLISIEVNDDLYSIRSNLGQVLMSLRRKGESRMFWVDEICINLDDSRERNHQTSLIQKIFSNASTVCVWLCKQTSRTDVAFDFIERLAQSNSTDHALSLSHDNDWRAVDELFSLNWFRSTWAVQEIAAARSLTIYCGSRAARWTDLEACIALLKHARQVLSDEKYLPDLYNSPLIDVMSAIFDRDELGNIVKRSLSLEQLVLSTSTLTCLDPRDRIYALLSLANDSPMATAGWKDFKPFAETSDTNVTTEVEIPIEYNKSVAEVFTDFVRFAIYRSGSLDILFKAWAPQDIPSVNFTDQDISFKASAPQGRDYSSNRHPDSDVPAWVCEMNSASSGVGSSTLQPLKYDAAGQTTVQYGWTIDEQSGLHVAGVVIGELQHMMEPAGPGNIPTSWFAQAQNLTAFCNTLVAERSLDGLEPHPGYLTELSSFLAGYDPTTYNIDLFALIEENSGSVESEFWEQVSQVTRQRRLSTLDDGSLGLFPYQSEPGDLVCIFFGCSVPVVLRQLKNSDYALIGDCYVHGKMSGQAVADLDVQNVSQQVWFNIDPERLKSPDVFGIEDMIEAFPSGAANVKRSFLRRTKRPRFISAGHSVERSDALQNEIEASGKASTDIIPSQIRLHWACACGYRGYSVHTELEAGVVQQLADELTQADFKVTFEVLGLEDPTVSKLKLLWTDLSLFLGNSLSEFRLFLRGHPPDSGIDSNISMDDLSGYGASDTAFQKNPPLPLSERPMKSAPPTEQSGSGFHHRPVDNTEDDTLSRDVKEPRRIKPAYLKPQKDQKSKLGGSKVPLQQSSSIAAALSQQPLGLRSQLWLLLCMQDAEVLYIKEGIDVTDIAYDQGLFKELKKRHIARRRPGLKWKLGIWRPLLISHVKFYLHEGDEVSRLLPNSLPPQHVNYYEFDPRRFALPPNDSELLIHYYLYPERRKSSRWFRTQIAKRINRIPTAGVPPDMETAWGLYIKDGMYITRLLQLGLLSAIVIFFAGLIIGVVRYTRYPTDMTLNWAATLLGGMAGTLFTVLSMLAAIATF